MGMLLNPYRYAAPAGAPFAGVLATRAANAVQAGGATNFDTELYDDTGWHSSGSTFTVPSGTTGHVRLISNIIPNVASEAEQRQLLSSGSGFIGNGGQYSNASGFTTLNNCTSAIIPAVPTQGYRCDVPRGAQAANNASGWQGMEVVPPESVIALAGMNSGNQAITNNVWTTLNLTNEVYDNDGVFSSGTPGTFTIQTAGRYRFTGNCRVAATGVAASRVFLLALLKNGVHTDYWSASYWFSSGRDGLNNVVSPFIDCVPGDVFALQVYCEIDITLGASDTANWFCCEKQPTTTKVCHVQVAAGSYGAGFAGIFNFGTDRYDPHGMWTSGSDVNLPVGTTRFRVSFGMGWQEGGAFTHLVSTDNAGGGGGHPTQGSATPWGEALSGFGMWKKVTTENVVNLSMYTHGARTFSSTNAPWLQVECEDT